MYVCVIVHTVHLVAKVSSLRPIIPPISHVSRQRDFDALSANAFVCPVMEVDRSSACFEGRFPSVSEL